MRRLLGLLIGFAGGLLIAGTLKVPGWHAAAETRAVTWREQVAPVVFQHCAGCHHVGGSGPFDLTTYRSAKRWGPQMADVLASRYMPPWLPELTGGPTPVHFEGDRRLKASEIELLTDWVREGMSEGSGPEPKPPTFSADWQMGPPDLVLEMPVAVTEPASGSDIFVNFVLPATVNQTRWVRAMEIQPGAGQLVHHANLVVDRTASLRAAHPADWQQGIPGMDLRIDSGDAFDPDSHFLFWKPDSTALVEPAGMPWRLDPGSDLVLNMHLKPTGKAEQVRARIGLYFSAKPAEARPMLIQLEDDAGLRIPAGDANFVISDSFVLPVGVDLLGVYPHAHYLGHEMEAWATLPGGRRQPILLIRSWDIDRQSVYRLEKPLALPKGTVLHMRYTYDNSAANVHNPNSPPIAVNAGNRAVDEMGHLWLQVLPHAEGTGDPRLPLEWAWMENILRKSPTDSIALYNLGALERMQGHPEKAEACFRKLLTQDPRDARAHTSLGSVLASEGDADRARAEFKAALAVNPRDDDAAYDLAMLELHGGESASAEQLLRQVVQRKPDDRAAGNALSQSLLEQGRMGEARVLLETSIAREADDAEAHRLLAMVYAGSGEIVNSVEELHTWARLTPGQPDAHRALAQVLTANGKIDDGLKEQQIVLQISPVNAGDWNDFGVMEARAGKLAEARSAFARALRLSPGNEAAKANLERLEASAGRR